MEIKNPFAELPNVPILFGLRAQGKLETVERMVREGRSWEEIGDEIGWAPDAAERFWKMEREGGDVQEEEAMS